MKKTNNSGFSLVELIVVIAIMAVLIGVLAPALIGNIEKSRESKDFSTLDTVYSAVKNAYGDEAGNKAAKDYKGTFTELGDVLSIEKPNAFEAAVKEYCENNDVSTDLSAEVNEGAKVYFNIDSDGHVTVLIAKEKPSDATAAVEADKTVDSDNNPKKFIVGFLANKAAKKD